MVDDATDYIGCSRWKSVRHWARDRVIEGCDLTLGWYQAALCVVCYAPRRGERGLMHVLMPQLWLPGLKAEQGLRTACSARQGRTR